MSPWRRRAGGRTGPVRGALALALASAFALAAARSAAADDRESPRLGEARRALEAARFDEAQRLLVQALDDGGNAPAAVREIYELSASTAIALGRHDVAEQYYRRWLAIDPSARLADGVAPKLQAAFASAQAYVAAHGRLTVTLARRSPEEPSNSEPSSSDGRLEAIVASDPLAMAHAVSLDGGPPVPLAATDAGRRALLAPAPGAPGARVAVLDDRANRLLELDAPAPPPPPVPPPPPPPAVPDEPRPPFAKRWTTWAVPAGALVVAGAIVGSLAFTAQAEVQDAIEHSGDHFFSDVDAKQRGVRRNATIGIALASAGALLAIPAGVFFLRGRPWQLGRLSLAPIATPRGAAVSLGGRF